MKKQQLFLLLGILLLVWWILDSQLVFTGGSTGGLNISADVWITDDRGQTVLSFADLKPGSLIPLEATASRVLVPGRTYYCNSKFTVTVSVTTNDPRELSVPVEVSWSGDASGSKTVTIAIPLGEKTKTMSSVFDVTPPAKSFYVDYYKSGAVGHKISVTANFNLPSGRISKTASGETVLNWKAQEYTYSASVGVTPVIMSIYEVAVPMIGLTVDIRLLLGVVLVALGLVWKG